MKNLSHEAFNLAIQVGEHEIQLPQCSNSYRNAND